MAPAAPSNTQKRNRGPAAGDHTGQTRERLGKEQLDEQRARSLETTMATALDDEEMEHGVFDPKTGDRIDGEDEVVEVEHFEAPRFGAAPAERERVFTGKESADEIEAHVEAQRARLPEPTNFAMSEFVTIRLNMDIEDMTYGMTPNGEPDNYSFRAGIAYKVQRSLAEHLQDIGVVQQIISAN